MAYSIEVEIERNYAAFKDMLATLLPKEEGRYALLHNGALCDIFDTPGQAEKEGMARFDTSPYSIQEVRREPIDLGFYSYAVPAGAS